MERLQDLFLVRDAPPETPAVARLHWIRVRDVVGVKVAVLWDESLKVVDIAPRDVVPLKNGYLQVLLEK